MMFCVIRYNQKLLLIDLKKAGITVSDDGISDDFATETFLESDEEYIKVDFSNNVSL